MKMNYKIIPSILASDFGKILEEAETVNIPEIDYLHVDVMDGNYVPNLTVGPKVVETLKQQTRFKLDVHLMVMNAPSVILQFVEAGADIITVHQEAVVHLHRTIRKIKDYGIKAGVTINPGTSLHNIYPVLQDVDLVLVLSVNPGYGGQDFIPQSIQRMNQLLKWREQLKTHFIIEVDGGINTTTIAEAYLAGAEYFVTGTAIFSKKNRKKAVRDLIQTIEETKSRKRSLKV